MMMEIAHIPIESVTTTDRLAVNPENRADDGYAVSSMDIHKIDKDKVNKIVTVTIKTLNQTALRFGYFVDSFFEIKEPYGKKLDVVKRK